MADISPAQNKTSFYIKRISGLILLLAMAAVFFFSAYSKMYSQAAFDSFQWSFIDLGINSTFLSGILARLMIAFECMLGLFLLLHIYLKQFTYPAIIGLLSVFIIYLLLLIKYQGNTGNCGCFGDVITMRPVAAIWKNVVMICVTVLLMYIYPIKPYKGQEWIAVLGGMAVIVAPFIINIVTNNDATPISEHVNLDALYQQDSSNTKPIPSVELRTGKHIVAFMSLTCPHCRKAAYLLGVIHRHNPDIPIFFVIMGPKQFEADFFKETHAKDVPYFMFNNRTAFGAIAGAGVPAIYWINNSTIERKTNYYQLDAGKMREWLKQ